MRRNWYAAGLLFLLLFAVFGAGSYVDASTRQLERELAAAQAYAEQGEYDLSRQAYCRTARWAEQTRPLWLLLLRRSLVDQLGQTLATLPHYANAQNRADLAVETARAREQTRQMRQSFFGRL